jgi:hypothetical protein
MAIYAGETVRIFAQGTDWDGTPLSPSEVNDVEILITTADGEEVSRDSLFWIAEESRWSGDWDTPLEPGPYCIEVTMWMEDETNSVDVRRVTLESSRGTPPTQSPLLRPLLVPLRL